MERAYRRQPRGASSTDAHRESTDDGDHASAPLAPLATAKPPALATAGPGWSAAAAYPAPPPPTLLPVRTTPCLPRLSCPTPPHPGPRPPPPPPHIFSKIKKSVPGIQCSAHSPQNLPRGRHRGLVRVHLFPPVNACSHRYSGQSMGHPLPPSLARRRARHPGGHNSWVVPFASDLTTRGPGGARAESNRTLG